MHWCSWLHSLTQEASCQLYVIWISWWWHNDCPLMVHLLERQFQNRADIPLCCMKPKMLSSIGKGSRFQVYTQYWCLWTMDLDMSEYDWAILHRSRLLMWCDEIREGSLTSVSLKTKWWSSHSIDLWTSADRWFTRSIAGLFKFSWKNARDCSELARVM